MTLMQWMLIVLGGVFTLLMIFWFGSYFISRAWYTAKLNAISSFASRRSTTKQPKR